MKINSNYQDYYDSALGSFLSSEVVINRKEKEVEIGKTEFPILCYNRIPDWQAEKQTVEYNGRKTTKGYPITLIGFCGQWFFHWQKGHLTDDFRDVTEHKYVTYDELLKDHQEHTICYNWMKSCKIEKLNDPNKIKEWNTDIFEKYGPVIVIHEYEGINKWQKNTQYETYKAQLFPNLKNYGFQQMKDPFTALWELEHWYDTHARPDEAIVPVGDDLTRLKAYGFDAKTSFRKSKEKI